MNKKFNISHVSIIGGNGLFSRLLCANLEALKKNNIFYDFCEKVLILHFKFLTKNYRYEKNYNDACVLVICGAKFCLGTDKND